MIICAVLLLLLINLMVSFVSLAAMYVMAIIPLRQEMIALKSHQIRQQNRSSTSIIPPLAGGYYTGAIEVPENNLPDMDDIPLESFYGDEEEDFKTTPEEVEDAIAERSHNTYNSSRTTSSQQLGSLKM